MDGPSTYASHLRRNPGDRVGYLRHRLPPDYGARLGWSLDGSISLITSPGVFLFLSWSASSHVEKYDKALHQGPESE